MHQFTGRTAPAAPQPLTESNYGDRVTLAFSNSTRPGLLRVDLLNGSILVQAYNGKDVIVEAEPRNPSSSSPAPAGLHRLPILSTGLRIEEQNNEITVSTDGLRSAARVTIQVPIQTNLSLHSVNGGAIEVEGVEGEIAIDNTNGRIIAKDVAGAVTAHSVNGGVLVTMRKVTQGKALSFVTRNGTVDVTLPADLKANTQMRTEHGAIWTDFAVQTRPSADPVVQDLRAQGGGYRTDVDRDLLGTINGGGPDITLTTFNGSIYIRKAK